MVYTIHAGRIDTIPSFVRWLPWPETQTTNETATQALPPAFPNNNSVTQKNNNVIWNQTLILSILGGQMEVCLYEWGLSKAVFFQTVVLEIPIAAVSGNMLEIQVLSLNPDLLNQNLWRWGPAFCFVLFYLKFFFID